MPSKPLNTDFLEEPQDIAERSDTAFKDTRMYYPSNLLGRKIRNAATGAYYPWVVGSKESKRLFRVIDSTGSCDKDGWLVTSQNATDSPSQLPDIKKRTTARNPNYCYYDSPQEYMKLRNVQVSNDVINRWKNINKTSIVA